MTIIVSTDGSALGNPSGPMGWAWADHGPSDQGSPDHSSPDHDSGGATRGTNQIGELCAVLQALRAHPGTEELRIETDSQYAINCSTTWVRGWKRNGWRSSQHKPIKNLALIKAIDGQITHRAGRVSFSWVKGHAGNAGNELVDELARTYAHDCRLGRREGYLPIEGWRALLESPYAAGVHIPSDARLALRRLSGIATQDTLVPKGPLVPTEASLSAPTDQPKPHLTDLADTHDTFHTVQRSIMNTQDEQKHAAGIEAAKLIENGMVVGLGTGSTVRFLVDELGRRVKEEGLRFTAVTTSHRTQLQAQGYGIPIADIDEVDHADVTIDGADEIDAHFNGVKGGGAALLWEKIVAVNSRSIVWIVDTSKMVGTLGAFPLPVEVIPFGSGHLMRAFDAKGYRPSLRVGSTGDPIRTDEGNYVVDLHLGRIDHPQDLAQDLITTVGVVEHGLFLNMVDTVIVGDAHGPRVLTNDAK